MSKRGLISRRAQCIFAESVPLTATQVERLERQYVGFEAEEPKPPKCPLMAHQLSNRIVKAVIDHDMDMLMERSLDSSGRPAHLQQKWKIKPHRKRLSPVLFRVGERLKGRVAIAFPTYALVDIGSTSYGVLHARDMSEGWIDRVDHSVSSGEDIVVIVKSIDDDGRFIRLTLLDLPRLESPTGDTMERRPLHSFKVEEVVSGVIRRRSPLGYYIDIGATVDGFLHVNDRKLPRKYTGVKRQPFRIGTRVSALYIKGIDLIKNRIQLSENSLSEEMEKRCITGQETPEQQSVYPVGRRQSMLQRMQATDLERMKMIGGYDSLLEKVGGHRNSTTEYVMYLQNRKMIADLEQQKEKILDDADNMTDDELRRATKEYNRLTMEIAGLNDEATEPPPFERTVYQYGEPGVWESRVYTPFDEKDPKKYFEKVTDEVTSALRDVQGENFNFKGAMADDLDNAEQRSEFVDMLWSKFHQAPSKLSQIEDTEPREPVLEDVEDLVPASLLSDDGSSHFADTPDPETVISTLESYNDPDADELAQMIRGAAGFNPFEHSPKLIDDEKSALAGACAMVNDDVTQWQARFDKLYEEGGIDPLAVVADTLACKEVRTKDGSVEEVDVLNTSTVTRDNALLGSVPNIDDFVDSTFGAQNESNFVTPTVDMDSSESPINDEMEYSDIEASSDVESSYSASDEPASDYDESDEVEGDMDDTDVYDDPDDDYKEVAEDIFGPEERLKRILTLPKSSQSRDHNMDNSRSECPNKVKKDSRSSTPQKDPSKMIPTGPLEPQEPLYKPSTLSDDIRNIFDEVRALTNGGQIPTPSVDTIPPSHPYESRDTKKIKFEMYRRQQRYMDPVTRLYMMTKVPGRPLPPDPESEAEDDHERYEDASPQMYTETDDDGDPFEEGSTIPSSSNADVDSFGDFSPGFGNSDYSTAFDSFSDDADDSSVTDEVVDEAKLKEARSWAKRVCKSDRSRRTLGRIARKFLPQEELEKYKFDDKDPEYMEELVDILRQGKERPKLRPYTYFPEGIDKAGLGEDRRTMNRRVRDANLKLAKLKRNKRFLHMLNRLGVDADELTFENIHQLLPRELISERPPPFRRLMGIGESNLPSNKG
ncbi:hypothetical protein X943_003292 [Babesia divergens]|uniref:S1 motif domain-containing protein n=1 Tax=Babesia divergens TaxID=32595 RepID=A0AAD9G7Q8_BABDI|nr:hypothetical protein X943_003292 [Babesia divergens]